MQYIYMWAQARNPKQAINIRATILTVKRVNGGDSHGPKHYAVKVIRA
jgi:hypothetical protein